MGKKRIVVWVLCMALGLVPLAGYAEDELFDSGEASQHIEQGIAALKNKKVDTAISEFQAAADISPEAEAFYYLGYAYYLKGRNGDAESRKLSRENFEQAYEIDPNFSPGRYKPGEPNLLQGQHEPEPEPEMQQQTAPASEPTASPEPAATQPAPAGEQPAR
jgi:tetratricopeptide (TPR) repeat protein